MIFNPEYVEVEVGNALLLPLAVFGVFNNGNVLWNMCKVFCSECSTVLDSNKNVLHASMVYICEL